MGIGPGYKHSCNCPTTTGNPDPKRFNVIKAQQCGPHYFAALVEYPDCKNYEGRKILVCKSNLTEMLGRKMLDPHFDEKDPFVMARFQPTDEGWEDAIAYCSYKNAQTHIRAKSA